MAPHRNNGFQINNHSTTLGSRLRADTTVTDDPAKESEISLKDLIEASMSEAAIAINLKISTDDWCELLRLTASALKRRMLAGWQVNRSSHNKAGSVKHRKALEANLAKRPISDLE